MKKQKINIFNNLYATVTIKSLISIIILLSFFLGIIYLSGFKGLIYTFFVLVLYFILFLPFSILWRKYIKKELLNFENIIKTFLYKISIIIFLSFVIIWSFSYYNNIINPSSLPIYTISSGNKTVIFQTMSHIGTKKFYNNVKNEIRNSKEKGYVLFYEGVKIEKEKNLSKKEIIKRKFLEKQGIEYLTENEKILNEFNKALGIKFDKNLYKNFSKLYGLVAQNNDDFLGIINNKDFNVDLTLKKVMKLYKDKIKNKPVSKKILDLSKVKDVNKDIIKLLDNLNKRELKVLIWINRGIMNFILKNDKFRDKIIELSGKQDIMGTILDERNKNLAIEIQNSKYNKIYVIYGMMHFKGVLKELQKFDKKWKIINQKELFPIK